LCTGNSARSQIAEALLRHHGGTRVEAFSAGSHPKQLHPNALRAMRERFGIDISGQRVKHLSEFTGRRFDYVISLCDRLREICPDFPGSPEMVHWSIPDPAAEGAGEYAPFERTAADLDTRVRFLIHHLSMED
jgi:protein-tyrosine-phosphatase